ncbi:LysR family transcriptional regulator substrate-binding protein [Lichenihabitans psoromatis]|uniref:LysR family transcriptional regulator substrate-binding protein n=1 Tax=Lichenihabitans psoromatis TaxID=2528642 RepID=UPI001FE1FD19|nr:LysR family transcriptional regulator substrate-binding protein [Lichenihabitans psoromatis]
MYLSLENGQLEFVIGPVDERAPKGPDRGHLLLYSEPLVFIPKGDTPIPGLKSRTISVRALAAETFVMVPDACGLARVTRSLFKRHKVVPKEYSGEALSYSVLQEWAALGIGAAILPQSKIASNVARSLPIEDKGGGPVTIFYQTSWRRSEVPEIERFAEDLVRQAPALLAGLHCA